MRVYASVSLLALGLGLAAEMSPASAQDRNLGRNLAAQCANCHGTNGQALPGMPVLAGRPKEEIVRLMGEFKSGARAGDKGTLMPQLARGYSDEQVALIAEYLSRQKPLP